MPNIVVHKDTGFVEYIQTPEEIRVKQMEKRLRELESKVQVLTDAVVTLTGVLLNESPIEKR